MRTETEKILISGVRRLQLSTCRYGKPLVLRGPEGIIIRDMMVALCEQYNDYLGYPNFSGRLFFHRSPVYCEYELSTQYNTYHGYIS